MPQQRDAAPTAERASEEVYTPTEHLSPELVLVSPPELAERARAALPDRPWEPFASLTAAELPRAPQLDPRLRPPAVPAAAATAPAVRPPAAGATVGTQERHRVVPRVSPRRMPIRRARFSRLLAPVAVIAFTLAAVTWASEQTPPLIPVDDPAPRTTVLTAPPPRGSVGGTVAPKRGVRTTIPRPATAVRIKPVPRGGYIFPRGRLVVSANGRSLATLELAEFCSQSITISRLPVAARGTFAYTGPALKGRFRVTLSGRFVDSRRVRFGVLLRGPGCPTRRVTAVGRLS
jgi:hypothetical protein